MGDRKITCVQKPMKKGNLESDDVFIIDNGLTIYQWNGKTCTPDEKFKAASVIDGIKTSRKGVKVINLEEKATSAGHPAMKLFKEGKSKEKEVIEGQKEMFRVSDEDGSLDLDDVDGYARDLLESKDVFIINTGTHVFCWVGKEASWMSERMRYLTLVTISARRRHHGFPSLWLRKGKKMKTSTKHSHRLFLLYILYFISYILLVGNDTDDK